VFNLCVCGDYVAAGTRLYFISVWNWKTGDLVSDQVRTPPTVVIFLPNLNLPIGMSKDLGGYLLIVRLSRRASHTVLGVEGG
jgi:hypothetical protein